MPKTCTRCGVSKPASEFKKNRRMKDGLSSWCSECHVASVRDWRRRHPKPPKPPKPLLTNAQIELVQLIAKGYDTTDLTKELGINRDAVKARCRRIKQILDVKRMREIPYAYWLKTGSVPFGSSGFEGRAGTPLGQVVEAMFKELGT